MHINQSFNNLARRIAESSYLSRWVVLGIDSLLSVTSSMMVYLLLSFFVAIPVAPKVFISLAVLSLLVSSTIFVLCGTYRGIMRHTTMHEVFRLFVALMLKDYFNLDVPREEIKVNPLKAIEKKIVETYEL